MSKNDQAFLIASESLNKACQPLFQSSPIKFLYYARLYPNRNFEVVISDGKFFQYYLDNELYAPQMADKHFDRFTTGFIYNIFGSRTENDLEKLEAIEKEFGLGHFLSYHFKSSDKSFCDFFTFASAHDDINANQFYLSNLSFLQKWSQLLLPHIRELFDEYALEKFNIPYRNLQKSDANEPIEDKDEQLKILLNLLQENTASGFLSNDKIKITKREFQCLRLLLDNKTAKEAARVLGISHRTIEHHYDRLKFKLDLQTKKQILKMFEYE